MKIFDKDKAIQAVFNLTLTAFMTLKFCEVINWSWIIVLSPLWLSALIVLVKEFKNK